MGYIVLYVEICWRFFVKTRWIYFGIIAQALILIITTGGGVSAASWDPGLDTARGVDYLTPVEKDVILEMNKARSNPAGYAEQYLKPRLQYFSGSRYGAPGLSFMTEEGKKAVEECISNLSNRGAVSVLTPERGIALAAKDQAADQSKAAAISHYGSDGSSPFDRMKRYGTFGSGYNWGENIDFGMTSGQEIVIALLIDDGVKDRGHRENILSREFSQTGVGYGTHPRYGSLCVIDFARSYTSHGAGTKGGSAGGTTGTTPEMAAPGTTTTPPTPPTTTAANPTAAITPPTVTKPPAALPKDGPPVTSAPVTTTPVNGAEEVAVPPVITVRWDAPVRQNWLDPNFFVVLRDSADREIGFYRVTPGMSRDKKTLVIDFSKPVYKMGDNKNVQVSFAPNTVYRIHSYGSLDWVDPVAKRGTDANFSIRFKTAKAGAGRP